MQGAECKGGLRARRGAFGFWKVFSLFIYSLVLFLLLSGLDYLISESRNKTDSKVIHCMLCVCTCKRIDVKRKRQEK